MLQEVRSLNKRKLNVRFHNPNSTESTLKYIRKIFVYASRERFERILQENPIRKERKYDKRK